MNAPAVLRSASKRSRLCLPAAFRPLLPPLFRESSFHPRRASPPVSPAASSASFSSLSSLPLPVPRQETPPPLNLPGEGAPRPLCPSPPRSPPTPRPTFTGSLFDWLGGGGEDTQDRVPESKAQHRTVLTVDDQEVLARTLVVILGHKRWQRVRGLGAGESRKETCMVAITWTATVSLRW